MTYTALERFGEAYARHRAAEGRGHTGEKLLELPYLTDGPLAAQWAVRACTFEVFMRQIVRPEALRLDRPVALLDLGAGNGWLSYRVALEGHYATALDIRDDNVDGLGAAALLASRAPGLMSVLKGSFEAIPLDVQTADVTVFNASLHYATDVAVAIGEAARVTRSGGVIAVLDSPFYRRDRHGDAMVSEKHARASERFGDGAEALMALPFVEYLTRNRLAVGSHGTGLVWRRRRVVYPLWYELRPWVALLAGRRPPSRFDLWWARRP